MGVFSEQTVDFGVGGHEKYLYPYYSRIKEKTKFACTMGIFSNTLSEVFCMSRIHGILIITSSFLFQM